MSGPVQRVFGEMETYWWDPLFDAARKEMSALHVRRTCRHPYSFPFATVVTRSFTTMLSRGTL